jgi:hypothetical protein
MEANGREVLMRCNHTKHESYWVKDARGIELAKVCDKCKKEVLARFRPDVLDNPNYWSDEDIEE